MGEGFPTREQIRDRQLAQLRELLARLVPDNRFYTPRIRDAGLTTPPASLEEFSARMPFTLKGELARDQEAHPPYGTNLTQPLTDYTRLHQTSSTTGKPLRWLDTPQSWRWMVAGWEEVLEAAEVTREDRVLVAFSFGPFLGLWLGFEAAEALGALAIPGGAMNSEARLRVILANDVTVLCCTPTYALRLGEVALETGIDLGQSKVRRIVVGGEPGASVPATRELIKARWPGAELFDHYGMTEAGPVTFQCTVAPDVVHVLETCLICEVIDPETGNPLPPHSESVGELVLTNLGRTSSPILRYRTGDLVRPRGDHSCACGREYLSFEGGILGRADDMVVVRGVNLFPTAVDQIVRSCEGVAEYRVEISTERGMTELSLQVEPSTADPQTLCAQLEKAFRDRFSLRIPVTSVPPDSLPRFELKARRWIRK